MTPEKVTVSVTFSRVCCKRKSNPQLGCSEGLPGNRHQSGGRGVVRLIGMCLVGRQSRSRDPDVVGLVISPVLTLALRGTGCYCVAFHCGRDAEEHDDPER